MINKISTIIHDELLPLQQSFLAYEKLANGEYRFNAQIFRKCAKKCQDLIDIARELVNQQKEG